MRRRADMPRARKEVQGVRRDYDVARLGVGVDVHIADVFPFGIGWNRRERDEHRRTESIARAALTGSRR